MHSKKRRTCQRKSSACAIKSLVLLTELLTFVVISLSVDCQGTDVEGSQDVTFSFRDNLFDDCGSKATVVTDRVIMQKWETCRTNFSQEWSRAEPNLQEPAHQYMNKRHSFALYVYTKHMQQSVKDNIPSEKGTEKEKAIIEPLSLHSTLSEAIQILKHSQVTCLTTNYRTETVSHPDISNQQVRFSTFVLGLNDWNLTKNVSCFEIYSCFGADVTYYSASQLNKQVLIPPYEVFKVSDMQTDVKTCKVIYSLRSNMNCVYDTGSNTLLPISAGPIGGVWFIFTIVCFIIISLLLSFVVVNSCHWKTADDRVSSFRHCREIT